MQPKVTILIPHFKTLELTKLCLRLIRKHTAPNLAKVIVIDNDSRDISTDYLREVKWIQLIERKTIPHEGAISGHSRALDLALDQVTTPYVLSIHTDTLIKHPAWLNFLIAQIEKDPNIAGVGSWKLENKTWWRLGLKSIERFIQLNFYRLLGRSTHLIEGIGRNYYYLRSHCAMYRTDLLRKHQLAFASGDMVAGKEMHKRLLDLDYQMVFLPSDVLIKYLDHINHATTVLNPELSTRPKSVDKGMRRIKQSLARLNAEKILEDASLDC